MDIHINKKIAGLMVFALIVGGLVGGAIGFAAGHEGHDGRDGHEMSDRFDNHADGETADDNGGLPNSDQQAPVGTSATSTAPMVPAE